MKQKKNDSFNLKCVYDALPKILKQNPNEYPKLLVQLTVT